VSSTTWSATTPPLAGVAGSVVLALGALCIIHAALTLVLAGAAWGLSAYACMGLAVLLAALRAFKHWRRKAYILHWDAGRACFRMHPDFPELALTHVWRGPGWVTLRLQPSLSTGPALHLVVWKSSIPAPLWSHLALCVHAGALGKNGHQNKENP